MALTKCEECGREISDRAPACPHCGVPRSAAAAPAAPLAAHRSTHAPSTFGILIGGLIMVLIGYGCYRVVTPAPLADASADEVAARAPTSAERAEPNRWKRVGGQGDMHFVVIEPPHDSQAQFHQAVAAICAGKTHCFVHFWDSASAAPLALPMTDAQVESEIASYRQNTYTSLSRWAWRCGPVEGQEAGCYSN